MLWPDRIAECLLMQDGEDQNIETRASISAANRIPLRAETL
jgi:hypothetical protein